MTVQHPIVTFDLEMSRQDEIRHRVEAGRLVRLADDHRSSIASAVCQWAGQTLIHFGEYLQRHRRRPVAGDLAAMAGALRISR
jgi:hypothetical protein